MELEQQPPASKVRPAESTHAADPSRGPAGSWSPPREHYSFEWLLVGPEGLRAGWSLLLFAAIYYVFRIIIGTVFFAAGLVSETNEVTAGAVLAQELIPFLSMLGAALLMSVIEGRRVSSYNLAGSNRFAHFLFGAVSGFTALSVLIGALAWGGWLHFGQAALSGAKALHYAALWGCAFLVVGAVEEGLFRCYGLFTLARGINFWWALAAQVAVCLYLAQSIGGHGARGVYAAAALGFFPCLILHLKSAPRSAFWQAAWVTSTVFGLYHTYNGGENWIGIFAAAFIGFVFCVSVRITGSALWAIGCHAAWDWAETFFYGTADSGLQGQGHFLSANPAGNPLWSGGADGPEGSLLVIGVILLLLFLIILYGRAKFALPAAPAEQAAD